LRELDGEDVREKLANSKGSLDIIFHPAAGENSALEEPLAEVARQLELASGGELTVERGDGIGLVALPCLTIAHRSAGRIHYQALPHGPERLPFVEAVLGPSRNGPDPCESWVERLATLERPAELLVFVGANCPHCPGAVRSANRIALASARVTVSIVDVQAHVELAERFNVRAVPLTILDGGLAVTGVVGSAKLVDKILSRDLDAHGEDLLISLVEQGRFDQAARRIRIGSGTAHLAAIWKGSGTSLRIGLLMAIEEVLEADRAALDDIVGDLLPILRAKDAAMRGDTADLLGRIGHRNAADALRALRNDPNPDVAEIASEALDEIDQRNTE
jgi:alkyl hydroperoxide reductase subunit AhpF